MVVKSILACGFVLLLTILSNIAFFKLVFRSEDKAKDLILNMLANFLCPIFFCLWFEFVVGG